MSSVPTITTPRLEMTAFVDDDVPALAAILGEPEVTKTITADGSTPERCIASARARIGWHNRSWAESGYGTWAMKVRDPALGTPGQLIGWCGFTAPDAGDDPEILYGLATRYWRRGLALEAARAAVVWLFGTTAHAGVSAMIFRRLNPASAAIAGKLGMTRRGTIPMPDFLPDRALAKDVLDYELWRLGRSDCADPGTLLFEAPYRGGQLATLGVGGAAAEVEQAFCDAARGRTGLAGFTAAEVERRVREAFRCGAAEPSLDWYHVARTGWPPAR